MNQHTFNLAERATSGKNEEIEARIKEAAMVLAGDDKLRREGKLNHATGKVKQAVETVVEKTKDALKDLKKK